jgi:hypothetical protein
VRAWTIHVGDTAPQAAGVIHTDFERGFIRAQTIAYRRLRRLPRRARRQGGRKDAFRGQGVRRQGRRRAELPVQRLIARVEPAAGRRRPVIVPARHGPSPRSPGDDHRPMPLSSAGSMPPLDRDRVGPARPAASR